MHLPAQHIVVIETVYNLSRFLYKFKKNIDPYRKIRGGDIAGTHSIGYESEFDSIELKHTAKTRLGFAKGALIAARWLMSRKEGFFTEKDLMDYLLSS